MSLLALMSISSRASRVLGGALVFSAVLALAPQASAKITPEVGGGVLLDFNAGGDTLLELEFSDGSDQKITGGQGVGFFISGGAIFFDEQSHNLEALINVGLKYSTMQATENANLEFLRVPIEGLAFYRNDDWFFRVGGGVQLIPHASLKGSGVFDGLDVKFGPDLGGIAQLDFILKGWALGLRYTRLGMTPRGVDESVKSHTIGFHISGYKQFL